MHALAIRTNSPTDSSKVGLEYIIRTVFWRPKTLTRAIILCFANDHQYRIIRSFAANGCKTPCATKRDRGPSLKPIPDQSTGGGSSSRGCGTRCVFVQRLVLRGVAGRALAKRVLWWYSSSCNHLPNKKKMLPVGKLPVTPTRFFWPKPSRARVSGRKKNSLGTLRLVGAGIFIPIGEVFFVDLGVFAVIT